MSSVSTRGRGEVFRGVAAVLAGLLAVGVPAPAARAAEPAATAAPAVLTVASEPAGANVFVDGQYQGATPLEVARLSAGDHRVRFVKDGYLENSRLVSVASGQPGQVQVRLTPRPALQVEPEAEHRDSGGGSSAGKIALIALGVAAVGAGVFLLLPKNSAPTVSSVTANVDGSSSATAIAAVTNVGFTANASDKDNDPLTYSWDFGDGATGSGAQASHVYARAGTYSAKVTVSDGKKSATGSASVAVREIGGTWRGSIFGFNLTLNLTQNGTSFSGSWADSVGRTSNVTGSLSAGRRARMSFSRFVDVWDLTADPAFNTLSGTGNAFGQTYNVAVTRQ